MSDTCSFCAQNVPADTYCKNCSAFLCTSCIPNHLDASSTRHQLINYQVFLEQNYSKEQSRRFTMKNVSSWLKERLLEANLEVDAQYTQTLNLIKSKQQFLHLILEEILQEKLKEHKENSEHNERALELLFKSKDLNPLILTPQDTQNFLYSEIFNPAVTRELENAIIKELNFNLEVYPTGKPLPLYAFKPNSSQVFMFDLLSEEEVVMNVKNFECKSFAGWCMVNSNIIYTGGWKQGYSSFEVFEINTSKWIVEPKPNLLTPRHQHAVICVEDTIYAFGGATKSGLTPLCEKWKLTEEHWKEISSLKVAKTQMGICSVGSFIYLSNDSEIERYCIKTDSFQPISVKFEVRLLSTIVNRGSNVLIFRPGELLEYETQTGLVYKVCDTEGIDLWSSTHPVIKLDKVFFFLENLRVVYSFDLICKRLELLTDFDNSDDSSEEVFE